MTGRHFGELLAQKWSEGKFVCVGLDPIFDGEKIPISLCRLGGAYQILIAFNCAIIDATRDIVAAFKPNLAFFLSQGSAGVAALQVIIKHAHGYAPDVPVILDCKDGDVGNTNLQYDLMAFGEDIFAADAITINPYPGLTEATDVFLRRADKGVFALCRTSNKGAEDFQDLQLMSGERLYERVAHDVAHKWNTKGNCGLVVGATWPEQLANVRSIAPDLTLLIPGIGKQGGDLARAVTAGKDARGQGFIINASSSIIFASNGADFAEAARRETLALHNATRTALGLEAV